MTTLKPTQAEYEAACLVIANFHYPLFTYVATRDSDPHDDPRSVLDVGDCIVPTLFGRDDDDSVDFIEDGSAPTGDVKFVAE